MGCLPVRRQSSRRVCPTTFRFLAVTEVGIFTVGLLLLWLTLGVAIRAWSYVLKCSVVSGRLLCVIFLGCSYVAVIAATSSTRPACQSNFALLAFLLSFVFLNEEKWLALPFLAVTFCCSSYASRCFLCRSCTCRRSNQPWQRCSRIYLRHPIYCLRSVTVSANALYKKCNICSAVLRSPPRSCHAVRNDTMYFATQFRAQILH